MRNPFKKKQKTAEELSIEFDNQIADYKEKIRRLEFRRKMNDDTDPYLIDLKNEYIGKYVEYTTDNGIGIIKVNDVFYQHEEPYGYHFKGEGIYKYYDYSYVYADKNDLVRYGAIDMEEIVDESEYDKLKTEIIEHLK